MKFKKRGAEESLSFLIGMLLAIMIITPIIIIGYRTVASQQGVEQCFKDIVKTVEGLKEGQEKEILCRIHPEYVYLGFDAGQDNLQSRYTSGALPTDSPILPSSTVLSYMKQDKLCKGFSKDGTKKDDLACLCFCKDNLEIEGNKKCSEWTKCAQFKGIKEIEGFAYTGRPQRVSSTLRKVPILGTIVEKISENTPQGREEGIFSDRIIPSKSLMIFGKEDILGLLVKKEKGKLNICVPGREGCVYNNDILLKNFATYLADEAIDCRSKSTKDCLCNSFEYQLPPDLDYRFIKEPKSKDVRSGYFDKSKPKEKQFVQQNLAEYLGFCTFDSKRLPLPLKRINNFSLLEELPESKGFTFNKNKIQLVKVGKNVCILASKDEKTLKLPKCDAKPKITTSTKTTSTKAK